MATPPDGVPRVAAALRPARTFDVACELVLDHLTEIVPMGMWAVTRVAGGRQLILRAGGGFDGVEPGIEFAFADTMCEAMVSGAAPQIAPDITRVPRYVRSAAEFALPVAAYVGIPIVRPDGELFGTVCGFSATPHPESLRAHQPLLVLLSSLLSSVLEADTATTTAERALELARHEADTDALTGLLNRRGWERFLAVEEDRFRRFGDPACVVVLDLDQLKIVNDTAGHDAGDRYIVRAADALRSVVRTGDVLARLGGDEFGAVCVGTGLDQAAELVERLERALDDAGVAGSFGHAAYSVVTGFPGAWKAADQAMYERKRARRARSGGGRHRR